MNFSQFFFFSFFFITGFLWSIQVQGSTDHHHNHQHHSHNKQQSAINEQKKHQINGFKPTKMFVFGDSYADTGNNRKSVANSWKQPYGVTFPGKPSGRFSDGRVLTDYLAKFLGVKSPVPYRWMKYATNRLRYGVNFAYGGTGVFDTLVPEPNMTTQIDFFQKLMANSVYTKADVQSSLFLLSLAGNDYGAFLANGGTPQGFPAFITSVVNQVVVNMRRVNGLGAKKIAVTALEPLGCLPQSTVLNSFQQCNATENTAVDFHNALLQQAVAKLNNETKDSTFVILDLFSSFTTVLERKGVPGSTRFETPLKPCCMGISNQYSCGSMNEKGEKMYTVCIDPKSAFFWDRVHPTEAGWRAVYTALESTLTHKLFLPFF
ncbi:GDSL esterase/lipase At5g03610 isoform X2 [Nicotiana tabacum]|uniref:GDSL esterase/lipase At5g03610 isoform X2 n=1 Tax=Nicotiana tabacum TaxID=4097 RepID=A0A1S4DGA0_TOBAC|nr:PREDICTED: GDSL esterase/lipase At5g03610-like isoform X2 [Nicotiana tabacum]